MLRSLVLLALVGTLAGCAGNRCKPDAPHNRAVAYPYLQDAPEVAAPAPTDEFAIPEIADDLAAAPPVESAQTGASADDERLGCLDIPPTLPPREDDSPADDA